MRAAVLRDGRMVLRDDVPEPTPGPGQVLVGVKACGICGSDLHFAKHGTEVIELNDQMEGFGSGGMTIDLKRDIFMGHEFSAEVLDAGPDTDAPQAGTLVTSLPVLLSSAGHRTHCVLQQHDWWLCRADAAVRPASDTHSQWTGSVARRP